MKVLQINAYLDFGSTGSIVRRLLGAQLDEGIDGYVMYGRHTGAERESERTVAINSEAGVGLHKFLTFAFGRHAFYSRLRTMAAVRKIKALRPDIVHLHNIHGHYLHIGVLFRFLAQAEIPVVWTFHDCWPYTGHCAHYAGTGCDRWLSECGRCPQKTGYPESLLVDRSRGLMRDKKGLFTAIKRLHVVAVSEWLADEVKQSFLRDADVRVIYNGVDRKAFRPLSEDDTVARRIRAEMEERFIILGVASFWDNRKGLDRFIRLAALLKEDEVIVLVGRMPRRTRPWQKMADIPVIPQNIRLVDTVSHKAEMAAYYNAAGVHVSFSREESFGLTIAEAMACGAPVVAVDGTASQEVVGRDGRCGTVLPVNASSTEAYGAIQEIRQRGRQFYTENGPARAGEFFDQEKNVSAYIRLYRALCESEAGRGARHEN